MERKQFTADAFDSCEMVAQIATLNAIDSDGDVVLPGAFGSRQGIPVLVAHDSNRIPVGKVDIHESGDQVIASGELIDLEACRWLRFDAAKPPSRQEFSWGFLPTKVSFGEHDGEDVRFIEELDLLEVSLVLRGASVDTRLLDVKAEKSCGCGGSCSTPKHQHPSPDELAYLKRALRRWPGACSYCGRCSWCKAALEAMEENHPRSFPNNTDRYFETERLHWQGWTKDVAVEAARAGDVPIPKVKFFAEAEHWSNPGEYDDDELVLRGLFDPRTWTIWLADTLSCTDMLKVLGHEMAHAAMFHHKRPQSERVADDFGEKLFKLYNRHVARAETAAMRELTQ